MSRRLSRRMFLRSSTGAALALPLLNDVGRFARGQTVTSPKRLVVIFTPNGTINQAWNSTGSGATFQLSEILTPLAAHKNDIVAIPNLDMAAALDGPGGDAHGLGIGCMLTGTELLAGNQFLAGMGGPGSGWPGGQSVDQYIAEKVGTTTKFRSLEFSIKRAAGTIWTRMSYRGAGQPVTPYDDPQVAFDAIFGDIGMDAAVVARRQTLRRNVLDGVMGEFRTLSASLSGSDKRKVEAHLASISDIQSRLTVVAPTATACVRPARPTISASQEVLRSADGMEIMNSAADTDVPQRQIVWRQLMVAALACDLTRVTSFIMAPSRSDIFLNWLNLPGVATSHHAYSHMDNTYGSASAQALVKINQWYAGQIANIITDMKATREGAGTMWDNTLLLWCNELGIGGSHSHTNVPFLLAGSAGGYIKTSQTLNIPVGTPHNSLLISLCNAMGLPDTVFGNPKHCTRGPLPGLKA
jgi:hypothetical protein